jgi:hypothetical protein
MLDLNAIFDPDRGVAESSSVPDCRPDDLPLDWYLQWDERAAIMEVDGGLTRERAEALALRDVLEQMRRHSESPRWPS